MVPRLGARLVIELRDGRPVVVETTDPPGRSGQPRRFTRKSIGGVDYRQSDSAGSTSSTPAVMSGALGNSPTGASRPLPREYRASTGMSHSSLAAYAPSWPQQQQPAAHGSGTKPLGKPAGAQQLEGPAPHKKLGSKAGQPGPNHRPQDNAARQAQLQAVNPGQEKGGDTAANSPCRDHTRSVEAGVHKVNGAAGATPGSKAGGPAGSRVLTGAGNAGQAGSAHSKAAAGGTAARTATGKASTAAAGAPGRSPAMRAGSQQGRTQAAPQPAAVAASSPASQAPGHTAQVYGEGGCGEMAHMSGQGASMSPMLAFPLSSK